MQLGNQASNPQHRSENGGSNFNGITGHAQEQKVPIMSLPVFDGNPKQWLQFRDGFQGLIDANIELTDIERMSYLRSALKGRATGVIQHLESSAINYAIAWALLKDSKTTQ